MGCNIPSPSPHLCMEGVGEVEVIYPTHPPLTKGRRYSLSSKLNSFLPSGKAETR